MAPDRIEKLLSRAQQAISQRDWEKAKQVYLMALGLRSDVPDIHYGLATVFFQLRELTSAAHHFREVTRLDPLRATAFVNLGAVLNLLTQYDDALVVLRRAIQLDPHRVEAYYNLGLVYRRKGQLEQAVNAYREAIRINPRMADAHLNLANVYLEKHQYRQAIQHYQTALDIRPGWENAVGGLAQAQEAVATPATPAAARPPSGDLNRTIDPQVHGTYLTSVHQTNFQCEDSGRLLHKILVEEVEPALKELSVFLINNSGSRLELEASLSRFENALQHLRSTRQGMKGHLQRLGELGKQFPT